MSSHDPVPAKQREPIETIALRVIVYGTGGLVIAACILIGVFVYEHSLLSSLLYRLIFLLILVAIILYVPVAIKQVYQEVARRSGK